MDEATRGTRLTYAGLNALAKCQQGKELHFTRVIMGDGRISDEQDIRQLTGLVSPRLVLPIKNIKISGTGTTVLETELKNTNLDKGFIAREVGIFIYDPDTVTKKEVDGKTVYDGTEILYAVRNTGDNSDYVPAGGGSDVWNVIYDIVTVIDQAENVTANINGDVAYLTRVDFAEHEDSSSPHPNFMKMGDEVSTADYIACDYKAPGDKINYISAGNLKTQILGDMSDMPTLQARVRQLERENANLALKMEAENKMPDCNMLLAENFDGTIDDTNRTKIKVKSAVSGDDSVDVESVYNLRIGDWIWVSDGLHSEYRQIKSTIKNGGVYRIILTSVLAETYVLDDTYIYFTTCDIDNGICMGSTDILSKKYTGETWGGSRKGGTAESNVKLDTSLGNADNFDVDGVTFDGNNLATLN